IPETQREMFSPLIRDCLLRLLIKARLKPLGDKDSEGNKPPADMEPINPTVDDPSGTGAEYQESDEEEVFAAGDNMEEETQADEEEHQAFVEGYYKENIAHRDQTDNLVEASMSSLGKSRITTRLKSSVESLQVAALRQDEYLASWAKSSNSLAWNLGLKMTAVESSQAGEHVAMEDNKAEEKPTRVIALIESSSRPPLTDPILEILTPKVLPITTIISTSQPEPSVPQREGKAIATDDQPEVQSKLVSASKEVRPDPDALILVPYEINGKNF
ncbi:hypothetical protein Tco_0929316, partial [Tanacetum coccineum]